MVYCGVTLPLKGGESMFQQPPRGRQRPPRRVRITCYVPPDVAETIQEWADNDRRTISTMTSMMLEELVRQSSARE